MPKLRLALLLLLPAITLTACGRGEEAEVDVAAPSNIDEPDLLGYWVVLEVNDEPPADGEVRYQFTAQGDFVRYAGGEAERARYTFAAPNQLTVDGPTGTVFYDYEVSGEELTLREPGEGGDTFRLRKLADQNLEDVPPPTSVPEEDSLPPDSL